MTEVSVSGSSPKPRRWLRWMLCAAAALFILLLGSYFILTSAAFLKGVILPKAGAAMNARITISDATISPFSQVVLRDLKVATTGSEPLLAAPEVRASYSLREILGGNLKISEIALVRPVIQVIRRADGTSNLDPFSKPAKGASGPSDVSKPSHSGPSGNAKPIRIDLGRIALTDGTVRMITEGPGGTGQRIEVAKINVTLEQLRNGQTGKFVLGADIAIEQKPAAPAAPGSLQARLDGHFDLSLGADLSLSSGKGGIKLQVPQSSGTLAAVRGFSLSFETELAADPAKGSAVLRSFQLQAARGDTPLLLASLSSPMTLAFGAGGGAATGNVSDAALLVTVTNVNLVDWRGFAPAINPLGKINGTVKVGSQQSGKRLGVTLAARAEGVGATLGQTVLAGMNFGFDAQLMTTDMQQIELGSYRLSVAQGADTMATIGGRGVADLQKNTADLEARLESDLRRLQPFLTQTGLVLRSGTVQLDTKLHRQDQAIATEGALQVRALSGRMGERAFDNLTLDANFNVALPSPQQIDLRRLQLVLAPTGLAPTNAVELSGHVEVVPTNLFAGSLKLTSDTLDVTPYYDLVAGPAPGKTPKPAGDTPRPADKAAKPAGGPETEPPAVTLPVATLTFDTSIHRCFLRELVLGEIQTSLKIEGSHVTLKPLALTVNNAPVQAMVDVNLGVPGYQYAVDLNATRVPLEPIANSFSPAYRGRAKGEVLAALNLTGAGITGTNLQKNLAGAFNLNFTNAEIQLVGPKAKSLLTPIAVVLGFSDLLSSPLRWLGANAKIADGKFNLSQLGLVSPAFTASTAGEIPIAAKLNDSPIRNWPVDFGLRRGVAEQLRLVPTDAPTNTEFVLLPNFVHAGGTIGDPKTHTDKLALLQLGTRAIGGLPGNVGKEANKLLDKADGLLGGKLTGKTSATDTNAKPASKLLDLFNPKKK